MASADQNNPYGLTAPPGGTGSTTTVSPIGVPTGYKAPIQHGVFPTTPQGTNARWGTRTQFGTTPQTGQYMPGDEYGPAGDLGAIPTIQAEMIAAGLIDKRDVRVGVWDAASASAYQDVLAFANQNGLTANDALSILVSNPPLGGLKGAKAGGAGKAAVISYTNPADVQAGFRSTSQSMTGQEQDPAAFQDYYHGLEAAAGHQTGSSYTQAPSVGGAAEQYVLEHDPSQVLAYGTASRMQDFLSMVGAK